MKKFLCGLAVIPFLASAAIAQPASLADRQPVPLTDRQMDSVNAGFRFYEMDLTNTSATVVSVYNNGNTITCSACYLLINNRALSVGSVMLAGLD